MDIEAQKEVKGKRLNLRELLIDYSSNSSIHGIKYVFSENRNWLSRLFWAIAITVSFVFSGYFLVNTFIKWQFQPDIGTRKSILNTRRIPFPAVTICPQTKAKMEFLSFRNSYKNYWDHFRLYGASDVDAGRFESMLHVCQPELSFNLELNDSKVAEGHDIVKILREISYSVDDSMLFCKFRNSLTDCKALFNEIVTDEGICYSFNMLDYDMLFNGNILDEDFDSFRHSKASTWTLDEGFQSDDLNAFPYPAVSQRHDSLRVILKTTDIDLDYVCVGSNQGFKVFFHLPNDFPALSEKHLFVPIKYDVNVAMGARLTTVSKDLREYQPEQRKCYMTHERKLKFFKSYTKTTCDVECLANYTITACGCVKFSMPRESSTKICDYSQINCTINAKRHMLLSSDVEESACGCLPSCTEIDYELESFQTDYDYKKLFASYRYDLSDMPGIVMSRLTIYFQEHQLEATERYALFTFSDYIASCGGVLGLFMGFSILSFIELIYYAMFWLHSLLKHNS